MIESLAVPLELFTSLHINRVINDEEVDRIGLLWIEPEDLRAAFGVLFYSLSLLFHAVKPV